MEASLIVRFVDHFIGGFLKTMKEKMIDGLLMGAALFYWFASGRFLAHFWENIGPWIWVVCLIIVWHTIRTAQLLSREVANERTSNLSLACNGHAVQMG